MPDNKICKTPVLPKSGRLLYCWVFPLTVWMAATGKSALLPATGLPGALSASAREAQLIGGASGPCG